MFLGTRELTLTVGGESRTAEITNCRITTGAAEGGTPTFAEAAEGGKRQYRLQGTAVQDPEADSLWDLVWSNAGETVVIDLRPAGGATPSATQPKFSGNALIEEADGDLLGGEARRRLDRPLPVRDQLALHGQADPQLHRVMGGVRVTGDAEVARALRGLGADLDDLDPALDAIGALAAAAVARTAPKRTGRLAGSARPRRSRGRVSVEVAVPYAGPINHGWPARNIAPSHFIERADTVIDPAAIRLVEAEINRAITRRDLA
jgi:hypothetical protein